MAGAGAGRRAVRLRDYMDVLALLHQRGEAPVIVGGHAVNLWAEVFAAEEPELVEFLPFHSEDLDLHQPNLGTLRLLRTLSSRVEEPRDPFSKAWTIVGPIFFLESPEGKQLAIDSLKMVAGLRPEDIRKGTTEVEVHDVPVRVLSPIALLKAKAYNVLHIDQSDRQDEKHFRILVLCVRAFVRRLLNEARNHPGTRRLLNALETVLRTTGHREVIAAATKLHLDLQRALPLAELRAAQFPHVANFVAQRLPYWRWLRQPEARGKSQDA